MGLDRDRIVSVCDSYIAAVGRGDTDAIMALYGDDPRIEDPVGSPVKEGRDAAREFYSQLESVKPKTARIGPVTVVGNRAAFQFSIEVDLGTDTLVMVTTDVMTFDDEGRILTMAAYADAEAKPEG